MAIIARTIHNASLVNLNLFIPGYDTIKPPIVLAPGATLDLFTVLGTEELETIQNQIVAFVAAGNMTVIATTDTTTFSPTGGGGSGITQLTGDVTAGPGNGSQVASIAPGVITNADINASAGINFSKLEPLPATQILIGNNSNVAAVRNLTGDASLAFDGTLTLATVNSDVGSFTSANITVDAAGRITAAANGNGATGNSGDLQFTDGSGHFQASDNINWDGNRFNLTFGGSPSDQYHTIAALVSNGDVYLQGNIGAGNLPGLNLADVSGTAHVRITAPQAGISSDYTVQMPGAQGGAGTTLQNDGTGILSWAAAGGTPAGNNTDIQFNNAGAFAGSDNLVWNGNAMTLTSTGSTIQVGRSGNPIIALRIDSTTQGFMPPRMTTTDKNNIDTSGNPGLVIYDTTLGNLCVSNNGNWESIQITDLTDSHIFVGNGSNVATDVPVSGDVTLANTGAFTIASQAVTASKIANNTITNTQLASGTFSNVTGVGSQSQALDMNSHLINNVTDPVSTQDAATKNYVDTKPLGMANASLTGLTANQSTTTLFTPSVTGTYRVSVYLVDTTAGTIGAGTLVANIGWTDDDQAQTASSSSINLVTGGSYTQGTFFIEAVSGNPVSYSTTVTGVFNGAVYNLYVVAERLS